MRGAVFDLDGTLLPGTSAERLFVPYLLRRGVLGPRQVAAGVATALTLPLWGRAAALRRNKRYLSGLAVEAVREHADTFVAEVLGPRLCPILLGEMECLRGMGHAPCLLTGTLEPIAEAVAVRLDMTDAIGTGLEVRAGRYTGRIDGPHFFGEAKVGALDAWADRRGIDLNASWGFADHATDVAFLSRVGHAVAVDPDAGLRREAVARSWRLLDRAERDVDAAQQLPVWRSYDLSGINPARPASPGSPSAGS